VTGTTAGGVVLTSGASSCVNLANATTSCH
jgi:hypothetical protein